MNNMPADTNRRVLVIDDNAAIHDDFRKILSPRTTAALDATEAALFGQAPSAVRQTRFEMDSAYQGPEGLLMVKKRLEAKLPYAMAFVDVRMPPGWDGKSAKRFGLVHRHRLRSRLGPRPTATPIATSPQA